MTDQTITLDLRFAHIGVSHLVSDSYKLDPHIFTFIFKLFSKCDSVMCANFKLNVTLRYVSTYNQNSYFDLSFPKESL